MEWLYLALTLLAAILAVVANALPLYREFKERRSKQKQDADLLRRSQHQPASNEAEIHIIATNEATRE